MARARNIKPGFFQNEDLIELSFATRLLFIGLWTLADKEGRLEDRPKKIKIMLFPADEIDIDQSLNELHYKNFISRYEAMLNNENINIIQIVNFEKHQNPHHREKASELPAEDKKARAKKDKPGKSPGLSLGKPGTSPSDSLIPDSLIPDSLQKTSSCAKQSFPPDEKVTKFDKTPYEEILNLYHEILPELNSVKKLTPARRTQIKTRWRNELDSLDEWRDYFELVRESGFLMGKTDPGRYRSKSWQADIDWLIKQGNVVKVCEGKYHGHG